MSRFEYNIGDNLDFRSDFANDVCKLLVDKYNGDYMEAVKNIDNIYEHFFDNVRNIYELVDNEIPLFALYELLQDGAIDNFGFGDEDEELDDTYEACLDRTKKACEIIFK